MDNSLSQFSSIFRNGSSHIFNCRDLTSKIEQKIKQGAEDRGDSIFLFKNMTLNRAVYIKTPFINKERLAYRRKVTGCFETKLYLPFEDDLVRGGQAVNFSDAKFYAVLHSLRPSENQFSAEEVASDQKRLKIIEKLPSLDPFLLKEKFRQEGIAVDDDYFSVTKDVWLDIRKFVMGKFRPLITFAYPGQEPSRDQINTLTNMLWESQENEDIEKMMQALGVSKQKIPEVLYAWKALIYYEFLYIQYNEKSKQLLKWLDNLSIQLGFLTPMLKASRDMIQQYLTANIGSFIPILQESKHAYDELFIHKNNAQPFVTFLGDCQKHFFDMSSTLGQVIIILQIWQDFCLRGNPYKASISQVKNLFETIEQNIL
ncbi:MAG: hypothetical protein ACK5WY_06090 [Holosporaceae bacterium]